MSIFFNKDRRRIIFDTIKDLLVIIILVYVIRNFIISPYEVSGPSMCPTLNYDKGVCNHSEGDYLIVNKFVYLFGEAQRGDIVVFTNPVGHGESYIKRIIGIPGDTVIIKDGYTYVQGPDNDEPVKIDESMYLSEKNLGNTRAPADNPTFKVPEGHYFLMGDNRIESLDSRMGFSADPQAGTPYVPKENIAGKAWIVLWPFGDFGLVKNVEINL